MSRVVRRESTRLGEPAGRSHLAGHAADIDRARARDGGGGGSRSATMVEFPNDFENSKSSIREKRQKAVVQVQNRYSRGQQQGIQRRKLRRKA